MFVLGSATQDYGVGLGFRGEGGVWGSRVMEFVFPLLVSSGAPSGVPSSYSWELWVFLWLLFFFLLRRPRLWLVLGLRRWLVTVSVLELVSVSCG